MFPLNGNLFDLPDVKLGLTLKASMLVETIEMYNPDYYPFEMLAKNKEIWIGKVEAKFYDLVEFANSLRSNEGITEEDERRLNDCVKKSRDQFKKYNFEINDKTSSAISTKDGVDALVGEDERNAPDVKVPDEAEIVKHEDSEESCILSLEVSDHCGGAVAQSNSSTSTGPQKPVSESSFVAEKASSFGIFTQGSNKEVFMPVPKLALATIIDFGLIEDAVKLKKGAQALVCYPYDRGKLWVIDADESYPIVHPIIAKTDRSLLAIEADAKMFSTC